MKKLVLTTNARVKQENNESYADKFVYEAKTGNLTVVGDVDKAVSCGNLVVDGVLNKYNCLGQEQEEVNLKVHTYSEKHKKDLDEQKKLGIVPDKSKKFQVIEIDGDLDYLLIDNVPNVPIIVDIKTPINYGICEHISEIICEGDLFVRGEVIKGVAGKNIFAHLLCNKMKKINTQLEIYLILLT